MEKVVSVFRSKTLKLHTTRSWDFLGLTLDDIDPSPMQLAYGHDVVVGIFDTGIWPESESFQEKPGMGPIPSSWKGVCVKGEKFEPAKACNRKLIGARYYLKGFEEEFGPLNMSGNPEYRSARDFLGHGTHTASTAAGSIVKNASFFGIGQGTARGGAPWARVAVYKICWGKNRIGSCTEADILAAFDDALRDGVHVISASFGATPPLAPFFASSADIGSFHAMQHGITVVFSAGNDGPDPSLVNNVAPWSICVAASTIDRTFPTQIVLDGNFSVMGESIISKEIKGKLANAVTYFVNGLCSLGNWNGKRATGKIVLCFYAPGLVFEMAQEAVKTANGSGLIFAEPFTKPIADLEDSIPTLHVDISQGTIIGNYLAESPKLPLVRIAPTYTRDTSHDSILAGGSMSGSNPFDIGAGHINPLKAMDPGLIYDMKTSDYILFLCNIGYSQERIKRIVLPSPGVDTNCKHVFQTNANVNYPSISISNLKSAMTIKRTVRNVGWGKTAIYFGTAKEPDGVEVVIWPRVLFFTPLKQEISYYVTLKPLKKSQARYDFGEIVWSDGFHSVRSPLVVLVNTVAADDFTLRSTI
ncbi:hypothetical protein COLO4_35081 [Corchorus olitorius]|uniref:Peptidase S8/S53 domain-containing protein n=1 Tax=Corchorus olitorius TaxID=93759 RepID=A0A1R3GIC1_9ROSI|nr:hypothetical protein COLO4_35081 [Corchorus olitorius]